MSDDVFTRDDNGDLAVRTVGSTGDNYVNKDDVYTRDNDGNLCVRVTGGGGGSDQHNLGYYATPEALREAHPTAESGDWAIVGSTDTVWVWDEDSTDWVDTDTKGEVTPDMVIIKSKTMPSASTTPADAMYQYTGATNANYTTNYIYRNIKTSTYTSTVTFEAATLSSSTIACSGSDFAAFVAEWGSGDITTITNGTITYDQSGGLLVFVGKDADSTTVCTFQLYTEDYQDAGFTITGTLQDGDVFAFTCSISEASATYAWTRVDVQPAPVIPDPLPSQTGNAGKFLSTDGTDASWGTLNKAKGTDSFALQDLPSSKNKTIYYGTYPQMGGSAIYITEGIGYGYYSGPNNYSVAVGALVGTGVRGIAIGNRAYTGDNTTNAIQLGCSPDGNYIYNFDSNTFKVANANGNFEMMSADGTIPTARLKNAINKYSTMPTAASTNEGWIVQFTGTTDANYTHGYIYECKAQGTNPETYAWEAVEVQASSGGGLQNTATGTNSLTILGTAASSSGTVNIGIGSEASSDSVAIGYNAYDAGHGVVLGRYAHSYGWGNNVVIGNYATSGTSGFDYSVIIGSEAKSANNVVNCIQLGGGTNPESNTFYVALNSNNYKLLGSDGSLPADRLASTTGLADGNYRLRLTMASGVPTLSWVAE